jgi:ribosomal protein L37AE/L43A
MEDIKFSYCVNCYERQDFILVNGVWICKTCNKPMQRATERIDKSLTLNANQGTIVTGDNYG